MATLTLDQYFAGGVYQQVRAADAGGAGMTPDQYAAGGTMGQLRGICGNPTVDQYAAGGIWPPIVAGAA